jgi:hypothetical protein
MDQNNDGLLSDQRNLETEEHQLRLFLTAVRPVGEEKSELYPEPQYFTLAFRAGSVMLPTLLRRITEKIGGPAEYGRSLRKILAPTNAVHLTGVAWMAAWGREILLLEQGGTHRESGLCFENGKFRLTDRDVADVLRFSRIASSNYRADGLVFPAEDQALGSNYRILDAEEAKKIARKTTKVDPDQASRLLGLMASVRALSFLMEAETREALMIHGPYSCDDPDHQLIIFECSDLRWELFPRYRIPGGVRWELPKEPFPVASIAIVLVLRGAKVQADRFGTLYVDPMRAENIVSASLLTRGNDFFVDKGLTEIPIGEAASLRRKCDDVQDHMFMQVAGWDLRQRLAAAVMDEQMFLTRFTAGAGFNRTELEAIQDELFAGFENINANVFDSVLNTKTEDLPFFQKLGAVMSGQRERLFTPLTNN